MDLQTVSSTYAQRNFGKILDETSGPVAILRDSLPKKVLVDYQEYLRMRKFEREQLRREFGRALEEMHSRNEGIDEKKLNKVIGEALHAAGRD